MMTGFSKKRLRDPSCLVNQDYKKSVTFIESKCPVMEQYVKPVEIRWADIDPNFHLRHSVYYDYAAFCRICFLQEHSLTTDKMAELRFGPILFREEAVFRKEVRMGDQLLIGLELTRSRKDFSRWSIRHQLVKNGDTMAAVITVDGAWINTRERKLATPPSFITEVFEQMPRSNDFQWHTP